MASSFTSATPLSPRVSHQLGCNDLIRLDLFTSHCNLCAPQSHVLTVFLMPSASLGSAWCSSVYRSATYGTKHAARPKDAFRAFVIAIAWPDLQFFWCSMQTLTAAMRYLRGQALCLVIAIQTVWLTFAMGVCCR